MSPVTQIMMNHYVRYQPDGSPYGSFAHSGVS